MVEGRRFPESKRPGDEGESLATGLQSSNFYAGVIFQDELDKYTFVKGTLQEKTRAIPQRDPTQEALRRQLAERDRHLNNPFYPYGYSEKFDPLGDLIAYKNAHFTTTSQMFWLQLPPNVRKAIGAYYECDGNLVTDPDCFPQLALFMACGLVDFYALEKGKVAFKVRDLPTPAKLNRAALKIFRRPNGVPIVRKIFMTMGYEEDIINQVLQ